MKQKDIRGDDEQSFVTESARIRKMSGGACHDGKEQYQDFEKRNQEDKCLDKEGKCFVWVW